MNALRWCVFAVAAAAVAAPSSAKQVSFDGGTFKVYQGDRALGVENFSFERAGDSVLVYSNVHYEIPDDAGKLEFDKNAIVIANAIDYGLYHYESKQHYRGDSLVRAIQVEDTVATLFRELNDRGEATTFPLPPGRLYVVDAQVFTLFDVMCRNLHGRSFDRRPLTVITLSTRDSIYEAEVVSMGQETIRWGAKPVEAKKLTIGDAQNRFVVWLSPRGQMLRLVHQESGLRVERDPPDIKPARRRDP